MSAQAPKRIQPNIFGQYMASLRESVGLSIKIVAQELKVTPEALRSWEKGEGLPPKELTTKISQVLRVTEAEWLGCLECEIEMRGDYK